MLPLVVVAAAAHSDPVNTAYIIILIIVGIMAIFGVGGIFGGMKWLRKQGVRDSRIDQMLNEWFGDRDNKGVRDLMQEASRQVSDNNDLRRHFEQHVGSSSQAHSEMWRAIRQRNNP